MYIYRLECNILYKFNRYFSFSSSSSPTTRPFIMRSTTWNNLFPSQSLIYLLPVADSPSVLLYSPFRILPFLIIILVSISFRTAPSSRSMPIAAAAAVSSSLAPLLLLLQQNFYEKKRNSMKR